MSIIDLSKVEMYARMTIAEAKAAALEQEKRRQIRHEVRENGLYSFTNQELIDILNALWISTDALNLANKELERRLKPAI